MSEISKDLMAASYRITILSISMSRENYSYQMLQTVKKEKMISSHWVETSNGRNRKYYQITDRGLKSLKKIIPEWIFVDSTHNKAWRRLLCQPSIS